MNDLHEEARALVELARDGDDPTAEDRARVRRRLATALAAGAATAVVAKGAAAGAGASAGAAAAGVSTAKVAAVLLAGLTAGVVAASAAVVALDLGGDRGEPAAGARTRPLAEPPAADSLGSLIDRAGPERAERPAASPSAEASNGADLQPRETARSPSASPPRRVARADERSDGPARASSIADETRLVEAARAALASGDGALALARASEHQARFPHGVLTEEARAVRVLALCRLGRTAEATRAAQTFLRSFPTSPQRARLAASCADLSKIP